MKRLAVVVFTVLLMAGFFGGASIVRAASLPVTGKAELYNSNGYLDFTGHNSNVVLDTGTGKLSGYAWSDDIGWVAFGTADNPSGPVKVNMATGTVSGVAQVINANLPLDFGAHNSNVTMDTTTGQFGGYVYDASLGWIHFSYPGVKTASAIPSPTPTPSPITTVTPAPSLTPTPSSPIGAALPITGAAAGLGIVGYILFGSGIGLSLPWKKRNRYKFDVRIEKPSGRRSL